MCEQPQDLLRAVVDLRTALARTGDVLREPSVDALLETELGLAAALAVLPSDASSLGDQRDLILAELAKARAELERCRRLGTALTDTVKVSLVAQRRTGDYGADGLELAGGAQRALEARG
jgi:hypothetical protein